MRPLIFRAITEVFIFSSLLTLAPEPAHALKLCDRVQTVLREGDLLFLEMDYEIFQKVARLSGGWTNHVGIAFIDDKGGWVVGESRVPFVRFTSLCDYVERTPNGRFAVRRLNPALGSVDTEAAYRLWSFVYANKGQRYDLGFDYDSNQQFCSKLVAQAYKKVMKVEVGVIQTLQSLFDAAKDNPDVQDDLTFWKAWYFGSIPWEQRTITPQSQYVDPDFMTVLDTSLEHRDEPVPDGF